MTIRALGAIVAGRLIAERRTLGLACATAAVVGFLQPHGIMAITDPLGADLATRSVWLAGPMFFCSTIGVAVALLQGPGRHAFLDVSERSAPLFGRELARAKALVPALVATIAAFVYWFAQFLTGFAAPPVFFALAIFCVLASSMVALNATVRDKIARWFYIGLACATAAAAYCLAVYGDALFARGGDVVGVGSELIF
ncbi:MAG: hypothetical protein ABI282_06720, partial [Candidatus Baltobacteraceae bacterium]